ELGRYAGLDGCKDIGRDRLKLLFPSQHCAIVAEIWARRGQPAQRPEQEGGARRFAPHGRGDGGGNDAKARCVRDAWCATERRHWIDDFVATYGRSDQETLTEHKAFRVSAMRPGAASAAARDATAAARLRLSPVQPILSRDAEICSVQAAACCNPAARAAP